MNTEQYPFGHRNYRMLLITFMFFNILLYNVRLNADHIMDPMVNFTTSIVGYFIALPIFSLLAGILVGVFTYKKLPFKEKYFRSFLLTLLAFNFLTFAATIIGSIKVIINDWSD